MHKIEVIGKATLYLGDCREILPTLPRVDAVIADPPYAETSLDWDRWPEGWVQACLPIAPVLWCFGSFRMFMDRRDDFRGWKHGQEIVWEKHNGSNFHADRFRRVHELAVMFYQGAWGDLRRAVPTTPDATPRTVRRKTRPTHTGHIEAGHYVSEDGGPRLMRSVLQVRSCHGFAVHPTQKPVGIVDPLIAYSVPNGGAVVDPMMGSGTTAVVCADRGIRFYGIENSAERFDVACRRIEDAQRQGRLIG
jgi:site-specific DNA-methyltransferase (adenine-specific)